MVKRVGLVCPLQIGMLLLVWVILTRTGTLSKNAEFGVNSESIPVVSPP